MAVSGHTKRGGDYKSPLRTSRQQHLSFESLENRAMLSAVTVTNSLDVVNGDTSSLEALIASDGEDGISLREALDAANLTPGADDIFFDASLAGQTIALDGSQLLIEEATTIDALTLTDNITIDAQSLSRVLMIDGPGVGVDMFDVTLRGLNLTGGYTNENLERGAAIRSFATGTLKVDRSGIFNNHTEGTRSGGAAVRTEGHLLIVDSTISGNSTTGEFSRGGALDVIGDLTIEQSTISGNSTAGPNAEGGAIRVTGSSLILQSTITDNHANDDFATGGGFWNNNDPVEIANSIIAGNTAGGGDNDLRPGGNTLSVNYSLIGDTSSMNATELANINAGIGNLLDQDPLLAGLAENGGPTLTHALLEDSPARNAGDPAIMFGEGEFDQRGNPYARVLGDRIDIGALEADTTMMPEPSADFDADGDVDGADFLAWQRNVTTLSGALPSQGDADLDEDVDEFDLGFWQAEYGQVEEPPAASSLIDLAMAEWQLSQQAAEQDELLVDEAFMPIKATSPILAADLAAGQSSSAALVVASEAAEAEVVSDETLDQAFAAEF